MRADLDLSTYNALMKGGGGEVVAGGDADGGFLYQVITHAEEPTMPPNGKLSDKRLRYSKNGSSVDSLKPPVPRPSCQTSRRWISPLIQILSANDPRPHHAGRSALARSLCADRAYQYFYAIASSVNWLLPLAVSGR